MRRRRRPLFDGETYDEARDRARLSRQLNRVWEAMRDRRWRTLGDLAEELGDPEASISARLRDLRKEKFGGYRVRRRYVRRGLWEYRLLPPLYEAMLPPPPMPIRVRGRKTAY
jgi:hypothetical protein